MTDFIFGGDGASLAPNLYTGWAQYSDTQYTDIATFDIVADTDTILPNNAGLIIDSQKPADVTTFYDGTVITGRAGDGLGFTFDCSVIPTVGASFVEFWVDIGGGLDPIYRRIISFPKGAGVVRPISFTVSAYTLGTWEANGGTIYTRSDGDVSIYDIRYVLHRLHKAR